MLRGATVSLGRTTRPKLPLDGATLEGRPPLDGRANVPACVDAGDSASRECADDEATG